MKVVINNCYGGFGLSSKAQEWLRERGLEFKYAFQIERHNPLLVECVETLGKDANGDYAELVVEEIFDNKYIIDEYDGMESVLTPDQINWTEVK